jgi:HEAT repeat protein
MRISRLLMLFVSAVAATVILVRPPAWLSRRHVELNDPRLLTEAAVSALLTVYNDGSTDRAAEQFYAVDQRLVGQGVRAVEPMLDIYGAQDELLHTWADMVLYRIGPDAVPRLIEALAGVNADAKCHVISILERFEPDPRIIAAVAALLEDLDEAVIRRAGEYFSSSHGDPPGSSHYPLYLVMPDRPDRSGELSGAVVDSLHAAIRAHPAHAGTIARMLRRQAQPWVVELLTQQMVQACDRDPRSAEFHQALRDLKNVLEDSATLPLTPEQASYVARRMQLHDRTSVDMLVRLGDAGVRERLEALLRDPSPDVRRQATDWLDRRIDPSGEMLVGMLKDPSPEVVCAALWPISRFKPPGAFDAVRNLMGTPVLRNAPFRPGQALTATTQDVLRVLWKLDPDAARPILESVAQDPMADQEARLFATENSEDTAALAALAQDPDASVRLAAIGRLIDLRAEGIESLLVNVVRNDPYVSSEGTSPIRAAAALGLGLIGARRYRELLTSLLSHIESDPPLVAAAVAALDRLGEANDLETLRMMSRHTEGKYFPLWPVLTLARARLGDTEVSSGLTSLIGHDYSFLAFVAMPAVWSPAKITPVDLLDSPRSREIAVLLGRMKGDGVPKLLKLLKLPMESAHPYVLLGLAESKDPRAWEPIVAALADRRRAVFRRAAAEALGIYGDPRAVPLLSAAMDDPSPWVRVAAALALERLTGEDFDLPPTPAEAFDVEKKPRFDPDALRDAVRMRVPHGESR